jgi:hypothetical protein
MYGEWARRQMADDLPYRASPLGPECLPKPLSRETALQERYQPPR